jgi:hypothetical protein
MYQLLYIILGYRPANNDENESFLFHPELAPLRWEDSHITIKPSDFGDLDNPIIVKRMENDFPETADGNGK